MGSVSFNTHSMEEANITERPEVWEASKTGGYVVLDPSHCALHARVKVPSFEIDIHA